MFISSTHPTKAPAPISSLTEKALSIDSYSPVKKSKRGAFIVFEGVDRCGKTTQCSLLVKRLLSMSIAASAWRFPDRTTHIGGLINDYLKNTGKDVDDQAIHLLFSANRWEASKSLLDTLSNGTTVICDRYAYSGVTFSAAKKNEDLTIDWCKGPDIGLPAPDAVIYLDLPLEEAEKRGGFGAERYETREMQIKVRERFTELQQIDEKEGRTPWFVVDASSSVENVEERIFSIVNTVFQQLSDNRSSLSKLWCDGEIQL